MDTVCCVCNIIVCIFWWYSSFYAFKKKKREKENFIVAWFMGQLNASNNSPLKNCFFMRMNNFALFFYSPSFFLACDKKVIDCRKIEKFLKKKLSRCWLRMVQHLIVFRFFFLHLLSWGHKLHRTVEAKTIINHQISRRMWWGKKWRLSMGRKKRCNFL